MAEEIKTPETEESGKNFIINFIDEDIAEGGQFQGMTVHTRFPPEPNGYLHIGHCKALTIDFGTAERYNGLCNLRMDDTNPTKEDEEFVEAIKQDIHWLGFDWGDRFFYGSDYFEKDYEYAVELIKKGLAYVCELTPEEFKANRGDIGIPATSPYRDRPIEENLRLFEMMKNGQVEEGKMTLRAKIDLASGNFNLRAFGERVARNMPIQGTAADMIKIAMIHVDKLLKGTRSRLILQIHDELLVDLHRDELALIPKIEEAMVSALPLPNGVPILVEARTGGNWLEAH